MEAATDPSVVKEALQTQHPSFAESDFHIDTVHTISHRYKDGIGCNVWYFVRAKQQDIHNIHQHIFIGKIKLSNGKNDVESGSGVNFSKSKNGVVINLPPDLSMVVTEFPRGPEMGHLPALFDSQFLIKLFNKHLDFPPNTTLVDIGTQLIKHVQGKRCTFCHTLRFHDSQQRVIYSKSLRAKSSGERMFSIIQTLRRAPVCADGLIIIPQPLFFEPQLNAVFVQGLDGVNADNSLAAFDLDAAVTEIGAAIVGVHRCRLDNLPNRPAHYILSQVAKLKDLLGKQDASCLPRVAALAGKLSEKYSGLTHVSATPIHGAFRLSQLLLVGDRFALVDFDGFEFGNPISDVASFVVHLLYLSLKKDITTDQSLAAISRFCKSYEKNTPWGLPNDVLVWQTAAHLLGKQAKACVKQARHGHLKILDQLLDLAENILRGELSLI